MFIITSERFVAEVLLFKVEVHNSGIGIFQHANLSENSKQLLIIATLE